MNAPGGTEEVDFKSYSGYLALLFAVAALVAIPLHIYFSVKDGSGEPNALVLIGLVLAFILLTKGVYILQPNQSTLLMLFGSSCDQRLAVQNLTDPDIARVFGTGQSIESTIGAGYQTVHNAMANTNGICRNLRNLRLFHARKSSRRRNQQRRVGAALHEAPDHIRRDRCFSCSTNREIANAYSAQQ